jgi:hypothetical protein
LALRQFAGERHFVLLKCGDVTVGIDPYAPVVLLPLPTVPIFPSLPDSSRQLLQRALDKG